MIESNPSDSLPPYHNFREGVDVICDRGEHAKRFNGHYRDLIRQFFPTYNRSTSAALKRMLAHEICTIVKSRGGKFYKDGKELTSGEAHKKVMKALKDHKNKPSSPPHRGEWWRHHPAFAASRDEWQRDLPALPPYRDEWQEAWTQTI